MIEVVDNILAEPLSIRVKQFRHHRHAPNKCRHVVGRAAQQAVRPLRDTTMAFGPLFEVLARLGYDEPRCKSVTIFDCRPRWHANLSDWSRTPVAQPRYDPDSHLWTLYWADRNSRWHYYDMVEPTPQPNELLTEIDEDPTGIFWG